MLFQAGRVQDAWKLEVDAMRAKKKKKKKRKVVYNLKRFETSFNFL